MLRFLLYILKIHFYLFIKKKLKFRYFNHNLILKLMIIIEFFFYLIKKNMNHSFRFNLKVEFLKLT